MQFFLNADGGSRGNPGPAGAGAVVKDEAGEVVVEVSEYLGVTTNNVAEYTGVLLALERLKDMLKDKVVDARVQVRMDSQLVVKQMSGEYRVKHPNLIPLATKLRVLTGAFKEVTFTHVYREQNKEADALANRAMDRSR